MPESPEVQALVNELAERLRGRELVDVDVVEFRIGKTRARPIESLAGRTVTGATRHGKLLDLAFGESGRLVVSLGRHGWARWAASVGEGAADPPPASSDAPPALAALAFDDGARLELTDAGNWVSLGAWVVDDPAEVPAVSKLGPDPAAADFSRVQFDHAFVGRRKQVKAVLQEQESLAGIGNAYSDEILHAAKISPVVHAAALDADELDRLFAATVDVITTTIADRTGVPIDRQKAVKVASMRVHGRAGEPCPICGDTLRDFSFASTTAQYCPTCQTAGEVLPLKSA